MPPAVLVVLAALGVAGCALGPVHLHRGPSAGEHMEYLVSALAADAGARESMWQQLARAEPGPETGLHHALLRSVPGHSGYDVAAAETELQGLLASGAPADVASVARARLEDLRAQNACRHEVEGLKRRLSKIADIEKRLDQERR